MFKKMLKNQKGLTLIELLVVVVILGIIAAIAIPSVGGLIDNSKKDAHIANAQQLISSARLYAASENVSDGDTLNADPELETYIEPLVDPDDDGYDEAFVTVSVNGGTITYTVTMENDTRGTFFNETSRDNLTRETIDN